MRDFLIKFLQALEVALPPQNGHHSITYAQYGNDVDGWRDELALYVASGGIRKCYFLDEADFTKEPDALVKEVAALFKAAQDKLKGPEPQDDKVVAAPAEPELCSRPWGRNHDFHHRCALPKGHPGDCVCRCRVPMSKLSAALNALEL